MISQPEQELEAGRRMLTWVLLEALGHGLYSVNNDKR